MLISNPIVMVNKILFLLAFCLISLSSLSQTVLPPDVPILSTNTCDVKTLTRGIPPVNVVWYWQGTDPNGILTTNSSLTYTVTDATNQMYYIRAKSTTANIWSGAVGVKVTTDPVDLVVDTNQPSNSLIQASHSITLKPGFTGTTFNARIAITSECNDFYNWSEQIVYDQNGQPLSRAREYSSALGQSLQTQALDKASGMVWVTQPIYDKNNNATASTLPAPISENDFLFKKKFVTNVAGQSYSDTDFNLPQTGSNLPGEIYNPKPVDVAKPNTVGWYYSNNNTLEPTTPTTAYPYSRSYIPEGPNPTIAQSAGAGDAYKMGSGNEVTSNEFKINVGELDHYFNIRPHFVSTTDPFATNLLAHVSTSSTTQFTANQNVTVASASGYVSVVCNQSTGTPGVYPIGGYITVVPGQDYILRVKGYRSSTSNANANLYVTSASGAVIVWPGPVLPLGIVNEGWVTYRFTPTDATAVRVGILWDNPVNNTGSVNTFYISAIELKKAAPTSIIGYKYISTDPDNKKAATFVDADGRTLATALITSTTGPTTNPVYTYDYWSYSFYNDMGQLVASVAPNGVTSSKAKPEFVTTYKYDHMGRLIETTSPDQGTSQFVYSTDGKIRFSENQVQREASPKRFSYTNYNYAGELVESGEYTSKGTNPYIFEPHSIITASNPTPGPYSVLNLIDVDVPRGLDIESINLSTDPSVFKGTSAKLDPVDLPSKRCSDYALIKYDKQAIDLPAGDPAHAQQNNLFGQVSKTQNVNATTWYSYDEFGQLKWSKQFLPDIGYKTVDYAYDYFGNMTQAVYQSGQSDKFYHYYTYDIDQRLIQVETSLDGTTKTLQAKYYYFLHGPLKRVELANNLQGIDYTYTLQGALKSINHMDVDNDPGADGEVGAHSNFSKDVFGLTLSYFDNDFSSAGHNAGNVSPSGSANSYAGTLKGVGWFTPVDNTPMKRSYNYTYDSRNQLQNAQWGTVTGSDGIYTTTLAGPAYTEGMGSIPIDKNGNIKSMLRNGKTGSSAANYTYAYEANTNKLDLVNDGGALLVNYSYNTIGQMIKYEEAGNTIHVLYNAYGLVNEIKKGTDLATATLIEKFVYDDRGDRIQKLNYNEAGTAVAKTTYYVHDVAGSVLAIYEKTTETPTPVLAEVPIYGASRLGEYKPGKTTFYELNDHLGNVRTVIGAPFTETITATMETENMTAEDKLFKNIAPRTISSSVAANQTPGGNEAVFLNNARPVGPAAIIKVAPGDVISISTYAYYEGGTGYTATTAASTIVSSIISAFGGVSGAPGDPGKIFNGLNNFFSGGTGSFAGLAGSSDNAVPAAFLNMIMFDGNMVADPANLPMSAVPVPSTASGNKQLITIGPITIPSPGYIYVYVNDNSNSANRVYFDDLAVEHLHSPFVAGGDFYPYGLTMEDRQIKIEPYRYGYQGQYSEKDNTTGWNEFELRMYDARFGRWMSTDPYGEFNSPYVGMGNSPAATVDPDGGCTTCYAQLGNSVAAIAQHYSTWFSSNGISGILHSSVPGDSRISSGGIIGQELSADLPSSSTAKMIPEALQFKLQQPTSFLNPSRPNIFARWNASSIPGSSFTYNIVNGAYIGLSTVFLKAFIGNDIYSLDRSYASYKDRQVGFVSTAAMFMPVKGIGTSSTQTVPRQVYTILTETGDVWKYGVTKLDLKRMFQSLASAPLNSTVKLSNTMPKFEAHMMEKYLRSLHFASTDGLPMLGMKVPYPRNLVTGTIIKP